MLAMIYESNLGTIGNTPIVRINRLAPANVTIFVKCEAFNPLHSVKDRLAIAIIEDAERRGTLRPGQTVKRSSKRPRVTPASPSRWSAQLRAIRSSQ